MNDALDAYLIRGVKHNVGFLNALIAHPRFRAGRLTTDFIAEEYPDGFHAADVPRNDPMIAVAIAAVVHCKRAARGGEISGQTRRFEYRVGRDWVVIANKERYPVEVTAGPEGYEVCNNGNLYRVETGWRLGEPIVRATVNGAPLRFQVDTSGAGYRLFHRGTEVDALVLSPAGAALAEHMLEKVPPDLGKFLLSPMPGLLVRLSVEEGQEAKAGEELAVVEAMKMENSLRATDDVSVKKVLTTVGESLEVDQPILEFE